MNNEITFYLIDDDEDDRELFQMALHIADPAIRFLCAASGPEALMELGTAVALPDYIFLDLNMPRMSGKDCLAELQKDQNLSGIPVVIFSTSSDPRDVTETMQMGAIDFITKPPKTSELTLKLQHFIATQVKSFK